MRVNVPEPNAIELHNPGHLCPISGLRWRGQSGIHPSGLLMFRGACWGIRAGMVIWQDYQYFHGVVTIGLAMLNWQKRRPEITAAEAEFVASKVGVGIDEQISFCEHGIAIAEAVIEFENEGFRYPRAVMHVAYNLAHVR